MKSGQTMLGFCLTMTAIKKEWLHFIALTVSLCACKIFGSLVNSTDWPLLIPAFPGTTGPAAVPTEPAGLLTICGMSFSLQ